MKKCILPFFIFLFLVGCGSKNISQRVEVQDSAYSSYNILPNNEDENITKYYDILKSRIHKKLKEQNISQGDELSLKLSIMSFDEGNMALRYFIGFGAGKTKSVIKTEFYNKNNKYLGEVVTEASLSMGVFGGTNEQMLDLAAGKIVDFAKNNYLK